MWRRQRRGQRIDRWSIATTTPRRRTEKLIDDSSACVDNHLPGNPLSIAVRLLCAPVFRDRFKGSDRESLFMCPGATFSMRSKAQKENKYEIASSWPAECIVRVLLCAFAIQQLSHFVQSSRDRPFTKRLMVIANQLIRARTVFVPTERWKKKNKANRYEYK